ncbi:MAG TPA: NYN domain-containing protein [Acidimicrobiia bacterium]|nr:NYN domain-containing protein [Acidimicrobiia bacterium]
MTDDHLPVNDALLEPLLDAAIDALHALDAEELPLGLRRLQGFDRRGFASTQGRRDLRRALTDEDGFRKEVVERFLARPEAAAILEQWSAERATEVADDADGRGDLPLLASVLYAARPDGAAFGIGVVVALHEGRRREGDARSVAETERRRREEAVEAQRRADDARQAAEDQLAKVSEQLRDARSDRREREARAASETAAERRRADALAADLERARAATEDLQRRLTGEAKRARDLEDEVRSLRAQVNELAGAIDLTGSSGPALEPRDARRLSQAATTARKLAEALDEVLRHAGATPSTPSSTPTADAPAHPGATASPPPERPLARRVPPKLPPGLVADSVDGADAMLRGPGVVLVVDGYNITKQAWPDATLADQRERLAQRLAALHTRCGCEAVVVFDGDGTPGIPSLRRPGLHVMFSAPGEEADEVVVREVTDLPKRVPAVVASSDAWVREHAEAAGAVVVSAATLIACLRSV